MVDLPANQSVPQQPPENFTRFALAVLTRITLPCSKLLVSLGLLEPAWLCSNTCKSRCHLLTPRTLFGWNQNDPIYGACQTGCRFFLPCQPGTWNGLADSYQSIGTS